MTCKNWFQRGSVAIAMLSLISLAGADEPGKGPFTVVQGISIPSAKHNLSFFENGIVREVNVKPGDPVKIGQILASEDTDVEDIQLKALKVEAESTSEIDAAVKDRDSKKLMFGNMEQAHKTGAATDTELEESKLAFEEAEIKIRYADEQHQQKQVEFEKQQKKLEKMKLVSPVDGIVEKINLQPGEVVDPNKAEGALTIIKNSPLWVDMHLPSAQATKLKKGDSLQVAYQNDPDSWLTASIIYFDPVVDAASDTQTVRVQLDNKEEHPAGLQLNIRLPFPPPGGSSASGR